MSPLRTGILLTNTGTPDAPTPLAVYRYLREFLLDKRVIRIPRAIWWPLLHGVILPRRCFYAANLYQKVWTPEGSPMRVWMYQIAEALQNFFQEQQLPFVTAVGMHYGQPSIRAGLEQLRAQQVEKIIALPLFPQYSSTTTATSFDKVAAALSIWPALPEVRFINQYADHPAYIEALCERLRHSWEKNGRAPHLLFSFHGIPEMYVTNGDPYPIACKKTAESVAAKLKLPPHSWSIAFQSRFGYARWLSPYTNEVLQELPKRGIEAIDIICAGFAVDCLETLEEIAIRSKAQFLAAGGQSLRYIPALNADKGHIQALADIIFSGIHPTP